MRTAVLMEQRLQKCLLYARLPGATLGGLSVLIWGDKCCQALKKLPRLCWETRLIFTLFSLVKLVH